MNFKEIGKIENGYSEKKEAPRQGYYDDRIFILNIHDEYEEACREFKVGDIIQVIYFADRSDRTVLRSKPPVRDEVMGVFSTRSPNRPNPILIDIARIEEINGNKISVSGLDALNNSPIVDIKGYSKTLHDKLMEKYL